MNNSTADPTREHALPRGWDPALPLGRNAAYQLWRAFVFVYWNGTADHQLMVEHFYPAEVAGELEDLVRSGGLLAEIEDAKRLCLRGGVPLSDAVLGELCAGSVRWREPLPPPVRNRLAPVLDELWAHICRQDCQPRAGSAVGDDRETKRNAALAMLVAGELNESKIARSVGLPRQTLQSDDLFSEARRKLAGEAEKRAEKYRGGRSGRNDFSGRDDD